MSTAEPKPASSETVRKHQEFLFPQSPLTIRSRWRW